MDEIMKIFTEGLGHLPETMADSQSSMFSEEILKNVFNTTRRYDLSLKEEDIVKQSDRSAAFSIDEGAEYVDSQGGV